MGQMRLIDADAVKQFIYENGYVYANTLDNFPTIDAVTVQAYEQVVWERDIAIQQLREYGVSFGEKKKDLGARMDGGEEK